MTDEKSQQLPEFLRGLVSLDKEAWFLKMVAEQEAEKLTSLHQAICNWHDAAEAKFESRISAHGVPQSEMSQGQYDLFAGEAFGLLGTQRIMLAGLAMAIASTVENYLGLWCETARIPIVDKDGNPIDRPNWGHKKQAIKKARAINLVDIAGFGGCTRARILGNCFKHKDGRTNDEYVKKYGGQEGAEIEYERENWPDLIDATRTFLVGLASRIRDEDEDHE